MVDSWIGSLARLARLNESPHPKVGKSERSSDTPQSPPASMKVPTRRWGNLAPYFVPVVIPARLNESPHPKVGKCQLLAALCHFLLESLNESPHPKVGKFPG